MTKLWSKLRRFFRSSEGSSTIEFVMWFPVFFTLFATSFELTYFGFRSTLLEQAVDLQVRELRLGQRPGTVDELKKEICDKMLAKFGDCEKEMAVDIREISPTSWSLPTDGVGCVDRSDDYAQPENAQYGPGGAGEFLMIRVCMKSNPFFGTTPYVLGLPRDSSGAVALVVVSTYVNEP